MVINVRPVDAASACGVGWSIRDCTRGSRLFSSHQIISRRVHGESAPSTAVCAPSEVYPSSVE